MQIAPISAESILEQLSKILSSSLFANAGQSRALLKFVVEQTVNQRTDRLKEYTVGAEAFGRGESFDPRTDTIVRAEASRLRSRLERYYAAEGRDDSILIALPKGGYIPQFMDRRLSAEPNVIPAAKNAKNNNEDHKRLHPTRLAWIKIAATTAALLLTAGAVFLWQHRTQAPPSPTKMCWCSRTSPTPPAIRSSTARCGRGSPCNWNSRPSAASSLTKRSSKPSV